jgi:hypothetical protein
MLIDNNRSRVKCNLSNPLDEIVENWLPEDGPVPGSSGPK